MSNEVRNWWNALDPFWVRIFKNQMDGELAFNKPKRDAFVPTDDQLNALVSSTELRVQSVSVPDLKPLLVFQNLTTLSLVSLPKIKSADELAQLPELKSLEISGISLPDFTAIGRCLGLTKLTIAIGITSLADLAPLKNLLALTLREPSLQNFAGVENFRSLTDLVIYQSTMPDFSPIGKLPALRRLIIERANLVSLDAIASLSNLEVLSISEVPLKSLEGIEKLSKLKNLTISDTGITDLAPLNHVNAQAEIRILKSQLPLTQQVRHLKNVYVQPPNPVSDPMGEPIPFPFKQNKHYRVIKEWYKNGTTFTLGQELAFIDSSYNHYDDVEICHFRDLKEGYKISWPCRVLELHVWKEYFEAIG